MTAANVTEDVTTLSATSTDAVQVKEKRGAVKGEVLGEGPPTPPRHPKPPTRSQRTGKRNRRSTR
jgi:hypothetical protein